MWSAGALDSGQFKHNHRPRCLILIMKTASSISAHLSLFYVLFLQLPQVQISFISSISHAGLPQRQHLRLHSPDACVDPVQHLADLHVLLDLKGIRVAGQDVGNAGVLMQHLLVMGANLCGRPARQLLLQHLDEVPVLGPPPQGLQVDEVLLVAPSTLRARVPGGSLVRGPELDPEAWLEAGAALVLAQVDADVLVLTWQKHATSGSGLAHCQSAKLVFYYYGGPLLQQQCQLVLVIVWGSTSANSEPVAGRYLCGGAKERECEINMNIQLQQILATSMLGEQKSNFFTVKDLSAADFISAFSQYLKKNNLIERPKWADYVKTSTATELAPLDDDWIYIRVAALARKIYLRPRTGVKLLSHIYGQKYRVPSRHPRHEHASTKIIRWSLQQLEKQKIIKKDKKGDALKINSRIISEEGRGTLNRITTEFVNAKNKK